MVWIEVLIASKVNRSNTKPFYVFRPGQQRWTVRVVFLFWFVLPIKGKARSSLVPCCHHGSAAVSFHAILTPGPGRWRSLSLGQRGRLTWCSLSHTRPWPEKAPVPKSASQQSGNVESLVHTEGHHGGVRHCMFWKLTNIS